MKIVWEYSSRDNTRSKKWSDVLLERRLRPASESSSTAATRRMEYRLPDRMVDLSDPKS